MALDEQLRSQIMGQVDLYWETHAPDQAFADLIGGKEPGHRMADYVDDKTTSVLKVNFDTRYEGDHKGGILKRSMGDIWVHSQDMFNPINVKAGLQGMKGQPNVVSMQKLLDYLFKRWIDAYYLLIIKFETTEEITHQSYLIDLLDWADFITYDAGPGQIMLREQDFYDAYHSGYMPPQKSILEKTDSLFQLFEAQVRQLLTNRVTRVARQRTLLETFHNSEFVVDQSRMQFVA